MIFEVASNGGLYSQLKNRQDAEKNFSSIPVFIACSMIFLYDNKNLNDGPYFTADYSSSHAIRIFVSLSIIFSRKVLCEQEGQ